MSFLRSLFAVATRRPTESVASAASIVAAVVVTTLGLSAGVAAPVALVLGHLPAIVTFFVDRYRRKAAGVQTPAPPTAAPVAPTGSP